MGKFNSKVEPSPGTDCVRSSRFHCTYTLFLLRIFFFVFLISHLQYFVVFAGKWPFLLLLDSLVNWTESSSSHGTCLQPQTIHSRESCDHKHKLLQNCLLLSHYIFTPYKYRVAQKSLDTIGNTLNIECKVSFAPLCITLTKQSVTLNVCGLRVTFESTCYLFYTNKW